MGTDLCGVFGAAEQLYGEFLEAEDFGTRVPQIGRTRQGLTL